MIIKVLGSGCANCKRLEGLVAEVVAELGIHVEVVKVTDVSEIMAYGVMSTPALVVNEGVKVAGRVPSSREIMTIITQAR